MTMHAYLRRTNAFLTRKQFSLCRSHSSWRAPISRYSKAMSARTRDHCNADHQPCAPRHHLPDRSASPRPGGPSLGLLAVDRLDKRDPSEMQGVRPA